METRLNVIFFLLPKEDVEYIYEDEKLGDVLDKMEENRHTAIPILKRSGEYLGTLTEGDLLWAIKNKYQMDFRNSLSLPIADVPRYSKNTAIKISTDIQELFAKSIEQNFVPVEDDRGMFIGIVTRRNIIRYFDNIRSE